MRVAFLRFHGKSLWKTMVCKNCHGSGKVQIPVAMCPQPQPAVLFFFKNEKTVTKERRLVLNTLV